MKFCASIFLTLAVCAGLTSCSDEAAVFDGPGPQPAVPAEASTIPSTIPNVAWKGDDLQDVPVRGTVRDGNGNPINATTVRLTKLDSSGVTYYYLASSTGVYDWDKVAQGSYARTADATGYAQHCDTIVVNAPDTTQVITLVP